jgi:hypothetical protein
LLETLKFLLKTLGAPAGEAAGQAAAKQKFLEMQTQILDHYERLELA